jgi:hypothetical protein
VERRRRAGWGGAHSGRGGAERSESDGDDGRRGALRRPVLTATAALR